MDVSVKDVEVELLIPDKICNREYVVTKEERDSAVVEDPNALDADMLEWYREAMSRGENLHYKFVIDVIAGKCRCGLVGGDNKDMMFCLRDNENLVVFQTSRYTTSPLIIKGVTAGPDLAASGMFTNILCLGRAFIGLQG